MAFLINLITIFITSLFPKKKNRWVFGSWYGSKISDNPKALYDYMRTNHPELEMAWIVQDPEKHDEMNCRVIKKNSIKGIIYQATSEVAVFSGGYMDLGRYNFLGRVCKVQLWHGVPWKHVGQDMPFWHQGLKQKIGKRLYLFVTRYDLYLATSPEYEKILSTAVGRNLNVIKAGYPRNSLFYDKSIILSEKRKLQQLLSVEPDTHIISYLPTFRDNSDETFDFSEKINDPKLVQCLKRNNAVIVQKSHYANQKWKKELKISESGILFTINDIDCQQLLAATDVLITDYSGAYFDFLILNRPVINYIYDYDTFRSADRGLYFPKEYVVGGSVAETYEELIEQIDRNLKYPDMNKQRLIEMKERFMTYENQDACKIIFDRVSEYINKGR